jgi:hypothetical protein
MTTTETPTKNGVYADIPDHIYHADRLSLSSSGARLILDSPAKYRHRMNNPEEHKSYFDIGSAVHSDVLGVGQPVRIIDADSYRTKAAAEARDQAYADGQTPLLRSDATLVKAMSDAVHKHPAANQLLAKGKPELSLYWNDPETDVRLRARIDWLITPAPNDDPIVTAVDLKTTAKSAAPHEFARTAAQYGYHFQAAWYLTALEQCGITHNRGAEFIFITVEKTAPHLVSVTRLHEDAIALGQTQMRDAVRTYAACIETGEWPGYTNDITTIDLPYWAYTNLNDDDLEIVI